MEGISYPTQRILRIRAPSLSMAGGVIQLRSAADLRAGFLSDPGPLGMSLQAPKDAHLSMVYFGVRCVLLTTSGTLLRVPHPD